ncbi:MAG: MotA/TolQ/ExbB proton channel family protein [Anaeromyxobacter sp.]
MITTKLLDLSSTWGAEWVMWALIAMSLAGLTVFLDRVLLYWRTRERYEALRASFGETLARGELDAALRAVEGDSLVRNVLRRGLGLVARGDRDPGRLEQVMLAQLAEERGRYEARLAWLTSIGNTAPLVGLLGTVIGIVAAFYALGKMGTVQAQANNLVMSAIGEALVATGFSISVAVPAVIAFNALRTHVSSRLKMAETLMRDLLAGAAGLRPAGGAPRAEG